MPDAYKYIPISKYAAPIIIVIATAIFGSLSIWWNTGEIQSTSQYQSKETDWKYQQRPLNVNSFSNRIRPLYMPLITLSLCYIFCGYILKHIGTISYISTIGNSNALFLFCAVICSQQTTAWFLIPLIQRILCGEAGASRSTVAGSWQILKCFIYGLEGIILLSLTLANPSLSAIMAVIIIPVTMIIKPARSFILLVLQSAMLSALSPPMILFIWGIVVGDFSAPIEFLARIYEYWYTFNAHFLPWICLLYWPLNLASQVLVTMEQ